MENVTSDSDNVRLAQLQYPAAEERWQTMTSARSPSHLAGVTALGQTTLPAAPRVLVVDDDLVIAELVALVLADTGWDVRTSTRCHEALERLRKWAADVIVLDLRMPDMDTESFLATCRQQAQREIPVLLLSAASNLDEQAKRLGVHGSLAKPFNLDELAAAVGQLVTQGQAGSPTDGMSVRSQSDVHGLQECAAAS